MPKNKEPAALDYPSINQLEQEIKRENYRHTFTKTLRSTVFTLITVSAIAILIAVLLLPVLRIYGRSMSRTLRDGDIVVSVKKADTSTGNIIAFYYNNNILVKRVIAHSGDWVNIDEQGNVYVNQELIEEPYIKEKSLGECNIKLPYQVPEGRVFVMGDNRSVSIDSRNTSVGCVAEEQVVGKVFFRIWPMKRFGVIR